MMGGLLLLLLLKQPLHHSHVFPPALPQHLASSLPAFSL
jgi:hypothetical protein